MNLRQFAFAWILFLGADLRAQDKTITDYGDRITPTDLKEYLTILASDAMEGRETGTRGQKMAAAFIGFHFEELGLKAPVENSFYQPFELYNHIPGEVFLTSGGTKFHNFQDVAYYGMDDSGGEVSMPVIFAGKGRAEDFNQVDVAGKGVLIILEPEDDYRQAVSLAGEKKAQMILILNARTKKEFSEYAGKLQNYLIDDNLELNKTAVPAKSERIFFIAPVVAEKIFNTTADNLSMVARSKSPKSALKKIKPGKISYKTSVKYNITKTENVLGYLEGTDKKDELIVITSHYDHIGKRSKGEGDLINNGADDDGSGTVAVMELAKIFAQAKKDGHGPRRSILFMTVTAEEKGLLGSKYYTQHPPYPLEKTIVNLNIDMIGRSDEKHQDSPPYIYVIGADKLSSELNKVSESVNKKYTKLFFDYTYNDQDHPDKLYYRSDHWNFAQKNIPIIFYFDGIHEDYHLPSDEVGKIEFDLLASRTRCIFYTAWEIANRDEKIAPDAPR